jgi:type VI secretion system protein ImpF
MPEPMQREGCLAPLFERLTDPPSGSGTVRVLDHEGLRRSILRELQWLLNTRSARSALHDDTAIPWTTIHYGVSDYSAYCTARAADHAALAKALVTAIAAFEPRLHGVKVAVQRDMMDCSRLRCSIQATLATDELPEPYVVEFAINADGVTICDEP